MQLSYSAPKTKPASKVVVVKSDQNYNVSGSNLKVKSTSSSSESRTSKFTRVPPPKYRPHPPLMNQKRQVINQFDSFYDFWLSGRGVKEILVVQGRGFESRREVFSFWLKGHKNTFIGMTRTLYQVVQHCFKLLRFVVLKLSDILLILS